MQKWPDFSLNGMGLYADALSIAVRRLLSDRDLDGIFAPRVTDEVAQSFFPGFAALRQPNVAAHLFTQFRSLPSQWQPHWHTRLWLNTLGAISIYDEQLRNFLAAEGPVSGSSQACAILGSAISNNWNFGLWSYANSATKPQETFIRFDLLVLNCCFVIESVESRIAGRPGGWRLVEEVLHVLDAQGTQIGVPWIHTLATSPEAVSLFRHYGFSDAPKGVTFFSPKATHLRRQVRPSARELGTPPSDLKHLFPGE